MILLERLESSIRSAGLKLLRRAPMHQRARLPGIALVLLDLVITSVVLVSNENSTFNPIELSIDCGSDVNYTDGLGINWVTDAGYIATGKNLQNLTVVNQTAVNGNQSTSVRYFDEGYGRDCYVLPVSEQSTYLIRSTFYRGDWNITASTSFTVYIDSNPWLYLPYEPGTNYNTTNSKYVFESLVYVTTTNLMVCLLRGQGTPFISALELRHLENGMYWEVLGRKYLYLYSRSNMGAEPNGPNYLRYPDDMYDRIWISLVDNATHILGTNVTTNPTLTPERPPEKVMATAAFYPNSTYFTTTQYGFHSQAGEIVTYSYIQEVGSLVASTTNVRGIDYYVSGILIESFNASTQPHEAKSCQLFIQQTSVNITFRKTSWSRLPPILNAVEIYGVADWNTLRTQVAEVPLIANMVRLLNLTDWTGDPCLPIPYDWLTCATTEGQIIENNQSLAFVTELGQTDAHVTGMNLSNGVLANFPTSNLSLFEIQNFTNFTVLDVSNNHLGEEVMPFLTTIKVDTLQTLNVSNNSFTGDFPLPQLLAQFPDLQEAIFDGNAINGNLDLTSMYTYMQSFISNVSSRNAGGTQAAPSAFPYLFSLQNNNITSVTPSLDVLTPVIAAYLKKLRTESSDRIMGILLAGNPWCEQTKPLEFPQSFLCRSSTSRFFNTGNLYNTNKKNYEGVIIGIALAGVGLIACFAVVLLVVISRLRRRTSSLKQTQEALARQKVQPRFFAYSDLKRATGKFSLKLRLGQGTFGAVYKGQIIDGEDEKVELVAVKELFPSKQALPEFLNEAVLITGIKHRNLVQLMGICIDHKDQRFLVYEYAENGNLGEALWGNKNREEQEMSTTLDWQKRLKICVGLARGLSYLHEELLPRIIHRDIKPGNILLDKNYEAKIADFGLARSIMEGQTEPDFTTIAGTRGYFCPEYAAHGQLTEKVDVFAFGVVVLEIVSGRKSIDLSLPEKQQFLPLWAKDLKNEGRLLDLLDPTVRRSADAEEVIRVINLAFLCLDFSPELRPTMSEAVTMLQGIMDVMLYKPELKADSTPLRREGSYSYTSLLNDETSSDSFYLIDTTGSSSTHNHNLELSKSPGFTAAWRQQSQKKKSNHSSTQQGL